MKGELPGEYMVLLDGKLNSTVLYAGRDTYQTCLISFRHNSKRRFGSSHPVAGYPGINAHHLEGG